MYKLGCSRLVEPRLKLHSHRAKQQGAPQKNVQVE